MKNLIIFTIFFLSNLIYSQEKINYQKLEFSDFLAKVPDSLDEYSTYAAISMISIESKIVKNSVWTGKIKIEIYPTFSKNESWIKKKKKTKELLNHEQRHFDIAKIFSNKLQKIVDKRIKNIKDYNENFQNLYDEIYAEYFDYQTKYEEITDRGLNFENQKLIDKEIDEKLNEK